MEFQQEDICPHCSAVIEGATNPYENVGPAPGDFSVCYSCAGVLRFGSDMKVHVLTEGDVEELEQDMDAAQQLNHIITELKQYKQELEKHHGHTL